METNIRDMLEEKIEDQLERISSLEPGTDEHSKAIDSLTKLYKLYIEETENERAFMARCDHDVVEQRELQLKNAELDSKAMDRWVRLGADIAGIVLPLAFYAVWMKRGFKFEETGTFTSTTFRGLFNCFKPKK